MATAAIASRLQAKARTAARWASEARARASTVRTVGRVRAAAPLGSEVASYAMPAPDAPMAATFVTEHRNEITAGLTVVGAIVLAEIVDRTIQRRMRKLADSHGTVRVSPVLDTRLRLIRRLVFATIIVIGIALALAQFPSVKRVAT